MVTLTHALHVTCTGVRFHLICGEPSFEAALIGQMVLFVICGIVHSAKAFTGHGRAVGAFCFRRFLASVRLMRGGILTLRFLHAVRISRYIRIMTIALRY